METNTKLIFTIASVMTLMVFVSGCTDIGRDTETEGLTTITVSAAATLTESFGDLIEQFEKENPEINVNLNLASSGALRMQIEAGGPIDVFASASQKHMDMLAEQNMIDEGSRKDFAHNSIVLIIPKNNNLNITKVEDLLNDEVKLIVISDPEISPAGAYSKQGLIELGIWDEVKDKSILAENVKQALVYVENGEVDAGFVFMTDAKIAEKESIEIVDTIPVSIDIRYPIAVLAASDHKEESQKFVDFVTSEEGTTILESYGFTA